LPAPRSRHWPLREADAVKSPGAALHAPARLRPLRDRLNRQQQRAQVLRLDRRTALAVGRSCAIHIATDAAGNSSARARLAFRAIVGRPTTP
jgi:hypothetical protein